MDAIEEKEGGDDIESSDSDNDDGDVGEFDPELEAKTKTLADQRQWHEGAYESRVRSRGGPMAWAARSEAEMAGWHVHSKWSIWGIQINCF